MWIIYTEIHSESGVERWYYGRWEDADKANDIALSLGSEYPVFHCVCAEEDARDLGIKNMYG